MFSFIFVKLKLVVLVSLDVTTWSIMNFYLDRRQSSLKFMTIPSIGSRCQPVELAGFRVLKIESFQ